MSKHQVSLEEYAADLRWAEQCQRWALPIAAALGALLVALLLWGLWTLSDTLVRL